MGVQPGAPDLEPPGDPQRLEHAIIDVLIRAMPGTATLPVGPGDDAAVLADGTAVTVDALVEGVHWDARLSAADVGWKAVAVNASDLGAMGAAPAWMVLTLALPSPPDPAWVAAFAAGAGEAARAYGVTLIGGDTTRSPGPRFVSITMGGRCVGAPARRSGGRPGDDVWVTGVLGLAGAGYVLMDPPPEALAALRRPRPPVAFAGTLAERRLVTAMMDLSDGLASDLPRLCRASRAGARIRPDALPLPEVLRGRDDALALAVGAGDDYELLFCAPPAHRDAIAAAAAEHAVRVTRIGALTPDAEVALVGRPWPAAWTHFPDVA